MLYTTQQLTGGPKYSRGVKVGNWQEDMELEEIKNNDTVYSSQGKSHYLIRLPYQLFSNILDPILTFYEL